MILSGKKAYERGYVQELESHEQILSHGILLTYGAIFDTVEVPMEEKIENYLYNHVQPLIKEKTAILMVAGDYLFGINEKISLKNNDGYVKSDYPVVGHVLPIESWTQRGHTIYNNILQWGYEGWKMVLVSYNYAGELQLNLPFAQIVFAEAQSIEIGDDDGA